MYSKQGLLSLKNFNLKTYSIRIPPLRSNESDICCSVGDSNHGHSDSILTQFLPLSNCFHSTPPILYSQSDYEPAHIYCNKNINTKNVAVTTCNAEQIY